MSKIKKDINGFAMAELLIVTAIILFIFSVLFANYLPLVGQYENRANYNNVTAQYASFYLRKVYKNAIENDVNFNKFITNAIENNGYYEAYSKDKKLDDNKYTNKLNNIIKHYDIEEIILTKTNTKEVKEKYTRDKALYRYIDYLPKSNEKDEYTELYRIILKTKYGYATTEILTDELSSSGCFKLEYKDSGFIITDYLIEKDECDKDVVLNDDEYSLNNKTGKIIGIGNNAFKNKNIESIVLSNNIKTIGDNAFAGNKIKKIEFNTQIEKIGNDIFKDSNIGKEKDEITVFESDDIKLLDTDSINWCHVLYGTDCVRSEEDNGYKYTYNDISKYITYSTGGDINE